MQLSLAKGRWAFCSHEREWKLRAKMPRQVPAPAKYNIGWRNNVAHQCHATSQSHWDSRSTFLVVKHFLWEYPYRKNLYFTLYYLSPQHPGRWWCSTWVKSLRALPIVLEFKRGQMLQLGHLDKNQEWLDSCLNLLSLLSANVLHLCFEMAEGKCSLESATFDDKATWIRDRQWHRLGT